MMLKFLEDYGEKIKRGTVVEVDRIRRNRRFASGVGVRVVGLWKNPQWFDLGWFVKDTSKPTIVYAG
jgi:hypothetical protein